MSYIERTTRDNSRPAGFCLGAGLGALAMLIVAGCAAVPQQDAQSSPEPSDASTAARADTEIALFQQAINSLDRRQLDRAEADLRAITKTSPELAGPWVNLALVSVQRKDMQGAQQNVAKALERNPRMAQAHAVAGFIEAGRGNISKAIEYYEKAVALKQDYALAHYNMALLHDIYLHNVPVAVQHYKRYLELTKYQDKKTADWVVELERILLKGAK